jgi:hypothetical protein
VCRGWRPSRSAYAGSPPSWPAPPQHRQVLFDHLSQRLRALAWPTTVDCEKAYKVACDQPAQIQQAYDLPSLYASGVTGRGTTIISELVSAVGDGKVILSRTGLGASLGNGVII